MGNRGFYGFSFQDQSPSFYQPNLTFPQMVSGLFAWHRPELVVIDESTKIAAWTDTGFYKLDAIQTTDALKPTLVDNVLNGYPALRFSGGQYLQIPSLPTTMLGGFFSWFFVIKPTTTTPIGLFDSAPSQADSFRQQPSGSFEWWQSNPTASLALPNTNAVVLGFCCSIPRSIVYFRNVTKVGTYTGSGSNYRWTTPVFGEINQSSSQAYSGDLFESILYNRTLNDSETMLIQSYLMGKYAIS
jgi:hypothetical protein